MALYTPINNAKQEFIKFGTLLERPKHLSIPAHGETPHDQAIKPRTEITSRQPCFEDHLCFKIRLWFLFSHDYLAMHILVHRA